MKTTKLDSFATMPVLLKLKAFYEEIFHQRSHVLFQRPASGLLRRELVRLKHIHSESV